MKKKHCVLTIVLALLVSMGAHAQLVSIQVFDILDADPCDAETLAEYPAIAHSVLWESGVMNALFDAGYIVSSMPVSRTDRAKVSAAAIEEARNAGVDILVCLYLEYEVCTPAGELRGPEALRPVSLSWELRRLGTPSLVDGVEDWVLEHSTSDREFIRQAEALGRKIISGLNGR